ncbi:MAG: hypothetical protein GY780_01840 [bacterium]|nr:hypothetical protein [bacterium]
MHARRRHKNLLPVIPIWLMLLLGLTLYGCSGSAPEVETENPIQEPVIAVLDTQAVIEAEPPPPPFVPVGLDTSFVIAAGNSYGAVLNADTLETLELETQAIEFTEQVVDTLAAVARFIQLAATGDEKFALSAADSQAVGHLILRGMAENDHGAALVLGLDETVRDLDRMVVTADSMGTAMDWDSSDPARQVQSREVKVAVLGFSQRSVDLRDKLVGLQSELGTASMTADSARTQQSVSRLVQEFSADLDQVINEMGRASRNISAGALSSESLRGLQGNLESRRSALLGFEARWVQFEETGSLDLANPADPYNSRRMTDLLQQMEKDLGYLATLASARAAEMDSASTFQTELESRRKAEEFVKKVQTALVDLKERNRNLNGAYGRLAASYWKGRLGQVADVKEEREQLYASLEAMVDRAGGTAEIREREDLLRTYRQSSDRLLELRRAHLKKVGEHDRLSQAVSAALAADLYNRARVLGTAEDYDAAIDGYKVMTESQPGQHTWYYQMASLEWSRSLEAWAQADRQNTAAESRAAASLWLDECEDVLLKRYNFDADMDETQALLSGDGENKNVAGATISGGQGSSPVARAAMLMPEDGRWYYRRFVIRARDDLGKLGAAIVDSDVRRWMLNIDVLRKRLAFETFDGDDFLYRYSRQAMLSENLDAVTAGNLLQHWSWDDGNLELRQRFSAVNQMPDTTALAALAKRDSLLAVSRSTRTLGARRQVDWSVGATEFLKVEDYDAGLGRMHALLKDLDRLPNNNPEVGRIDSTITAVYPVFLYNRGTFYQQEGKSQEAFYCFLGVAEQYATDLKTVATARYSAASVLADGNKRGALGLVRASINEALRVIGDDPTNFDLETLVAMYELRQTLAGDLGMFQEAVKARNEAATLRGLMDQSAGVSP